MWGIQDAHEQMNHVLLELRSASDMSPWPSDAAARNIPTPSEIVDTATLLRLESPAIRDRAIYALKHVLEPIGWRVGNMCRHVTPYTNGDDPVGLCRLHQVELIAREGREGDRQTVEDIKAASRLVLACMVMKAYGHEDEPLKRVFIAVRVPESTNRRRRTAGSMEINLTPTEEEQHARTCSESPELHLYLKRYPPRKNGVFAAISTFIVETPEGRDLLRRANIDLHGFQIDHYLPENFGGPDHILNAYLLPARVNASFQETLDARKRKYCGRWQHEALLKWMARAAQLEWQCAM